ncbi:MAG: ABC transporter ATP-binding protein [Vampirovibrio sp.]|nr:ABC transporter ATP-binding protein [Vampirovibrio sp.]
MTSHAIALENVCKIYADGDRKVEALSDISLSVSPGEFVALMGPSGCGKSTLLNLIGAIDRPTSGKILIENTDTSILDDTGLTKLRQTKMGYVFQFFNLLTTLTVKENVALPLELAGQMTEEEMHIRVSNLLNQVGMDHRLDFYPANLSGGEMQRVAIARALVNKPDIILADEPTGNLDTENGQHVLELLQRLTQENGQTVLMATHSLEAAQYAHRTLTIRDGKLVDNQTPSPVETGA